MFFKQKQDQGDLDYAGVNKDVDPRLQLLMQFYDGLHRGCFHY